MALARSGLLAAICFALVFGTLAAQDIPSKPKKQEPAPKEKEPAPAPKEKEPAPAPKEKEPAPAAGKSVLVASSEGRFHVTLPPGFPRPEVSRDTVPTAVGDVKMIMFVSEKGSSACMVSYNDYPAGVFEKADTKKMLDGGRDGGLARVSGKLVKEEDYTFEGNPGRRFWFTGTLGDMKVHGRAEALIVKPRLFQVLILAEDKSLIDASGTDAFFASFGLLKEAERTVLDSAEGGFKVVFPPEYPKPVKNEQKVPTDAGEVKLVMHLSDGGTKVCGVMYCDYPEGTIADKGKKQAYDNARDGALANMGAELEKEEDFKLCGHDARRIIVKTGGPMPLFGRIEYLVVGERLYQVMCLSTDKDERFSLELEAFYYSFELKK
ncbi:MAG: hypothetical protein ACYTAF_08875 [Planctomycetota bacterium]